MAAGTGKTELSTPQVNVSTQKVEVTMASATASGGGSPGDSNAESLKYLLGGAAVLQAVLTAIGVSTGGVSALAINHRWLTIGGFGAVVVAIAIAAVVLALNLGKRRIGRDLTALGTILLFVGILITAYAALIEPGVAKTPNINVALSNAKNQLSVTAHVTASGIRENTPYWLEIDAREYQTGGKGGNYVPLGTPLYQNQLGSDGEGKINSIVTIPIPPGTFNVISVEAWNGAHAGPCGSLEVEGGANLTQLPKLSATSLLEESGRAGCVVLRLPR